MGKNFALSIILILVFTVIIFAQKQKHEDMHALLIVGHQESQTSDGIKGMNKIAKLLEDYNITVHKFYDKQARWADIIKIAPQCSFLLYDGHGSNMGIDGTTGGLCLTSIVSTQEILDELQLKENALVLFQSVCMGAGSSASDDEDIGMPKARGRVEDYAYPFFYAGASAYYANNFKDGVYDFLKLFLDGATLNYAFKKTADFWTVIELKASYQDDPEKTISIATTPGGGKGTQTIWENGVKRTKTIIMPKDYCIAYVGKENFSIKDMYLH